VRYRKHGHECGVLWSLEPGRGSKRRRKSIDGSETRCTDVILFAVRLTGQRGATNGSLSVLFGETEGGAGRSAILRVSFARPKKPLRQIVRRAVRDTRCGVARSYRSPVIGRFSVSYRRRSDLAQGRGEGESEVIFMPVFYCALARESRMETICHPVGKASW